MAKRPHFPLVVGTMLACAGLTVAAAFAQGDGGQQPESSSARGSDSGANESAQKIDKAIQAYQDRAARDLEQTRKDLDRMRKELGELIEMRIDLAIAAAELRAEFGPIGVAPGAGQPLFGAFPNAAGQPGAPAGSGGQSRGPASVNQELRQVQTLLHGEIQQARDQADQLVGQLRDLQAKQRARQEQMKADRERERAAKEQARKLREGEKKDVERPGAPSK